jgi:hypothetical protein
MSQTARATGTNLAPLAWPLKQNNHKDRRLVLLYLLSLLLVCEEAFDMAATMLVTGQAKLQ